MTVRLWGRFDQPLVDSTLARIVPAESSAAALLLARYRALGDSFLDRLTGAFAVEVDDGEANRQILACDGMGNRTLTYALTGNRFEASPDAWRLAAASTGGRPPALRLAEYFAYEELSGPETFFPGVKALLPGEMLLVEAGTLRRRWLARPALDRRLERTHWEEYVEELAERLLAAVQRSVAGTSRVAVLMSGGLDSTPIAAWASRLLGRVRGAPAVTALSWRLADRAADESALVREVAAQADLALEWIDCEDAVPFSRLDEWPVHPGTPEQTSFRWFHQRSYARAAALGHEILLTGFCGDALYVGARRWAWDLLAAEGPGATIDALRTVASSLGWATTLRRHLFGPLLPQTRALRRAAPTYLLPEVRALLADRPVWPREAERARRPRQAERVLSLLDSYGAQIERHYTAAFGIEQRTPLRDFALVEFLLAVPDHLLQRGDESRPGLRAAIAGLVPESVRRRRDKASFHSVHDRGMATGNLRWAEAVLFADDALWRGLIPEALVRSWSAETPSDPWERLGFQQVLFGELWRRERAGLPRPSAGAIDESGRL